MKTLEYIEGKRSKNEKLLAILIDPDKVEKSADLENICINLSQNKPDIILIGGSLINNGRFEEVVKKLKSLSIAPVIIFPGNNKQISPSADGILLLSLISGRNPEYLIGQHVASAFDLKKSGIDILSTGYILVDCGNTTAAAYMSNTQPIPYLKNGIACATALAGEQIGNGLIYLDGGSGADKPVSAGMIQSVKRTLSVPLIVGGGIKTTEQAISAWRNGADIIVIGTAFEEDPNFINALNRAKMEVQ